MTEAPAKSRFDSRSAVSPSTGQTMESRGAVSIVVPTLREAANLRLLAKRISGALAGSGIEWELLLVDDDSDDGSEDVVAELSRRLPVRMEVRRGASPDLSRAVLEGIGLSRFNRIVVMDADLSHPPERIPDLLAGLDADCDLVVGSRYFAGASTAREWGLGAQAQLAHRDLARGASGDLFRSPGGVLRR